MSDTLFSPLEASPGWQQILEGWLRGAEAQKLAQFVSREREGAVPVYPPQKEVFRAFEKTPYDKVKVVIVGQDPYHQPRQANGLSFSVHDGVPFPPSLRNIFQELSEDLHTSPPSSGSLDRWADQGVLLLNATLTVRHGEPLSHRGKGWEAFTDFVVYQLSQRKQPMVFVLWGRSAQQKCFFLDTVKPFPHFVLKSPHPSPFSASRGFFGSRPFSKVNQLLESWGYAPIQW